MKKMYRNLLLVALVFWVTVGSAQNIDTDALYFYPEKSDTVFYQQFLKSNIERAVKMQTISILCASTAAGLMVAGSLTKHDNNMRNVYFIAGGGLLVYSYVALWQHNRFLKKHSVELTGSGIVKRF